MIKISKRLTFLVLLFILFLQGCSFSSLLVGGRTSQQLVIVDYPPNRIAYTGDMTESQKDLMLSVLGLLGKEKYRNHRYDHVIGVDLESNIINDFDHDWSHKISTCTKKTANKKANK